MPSLRRLILTAAGLLLVFIVGTLYFFEFRAIGQLHLAIEEREELLKQKQETVRNYKGKVAFYKTREGVEHLAREQYNLAFPGERVVVIVSEDVPPHFR
ncbi:MAG: septum formation initiator [Fretibacterium sp.]|nr:septum formation initiator [Fretibacterium sp.]